MLAFQNHRYRQFHPFPLSSWDQNPRGKYSPMSQKRNVQLLLKCSKADYLCRQRGMVPLQGKKQALPRLLQRRWEASVSWLTKVVAMVVVTEACTRSHVTEKRAWPLQQQQSISIPVTIRLWQSFRNNRKSKRKWQFESESQQHENNKLTDLTEAEIHNPKMVANLTPQVCVSAEIAV